MARKKKEEEKTGAPAWMTTYGDMVTLLLTFFVLLFSFSTIDVMQFQKMLLSFKGAIGVLKGGKTFNEEKLVGMGFRGIDAGEVVRQTRYLKEVISKLTGILKAANLQNQVFIRITERGVTISFMDKVLFDSGSVELKPEAKRILYKIGQILKNIPNHMVVEGHTDNVPIHTPRFPSNWELSAVRAAVVTRYLVDEVGIDPDKIHSAGYGQYKPVVPNDTPEHRALNRRVDIVILTSKRIFP